MNVQRLSVDVLTASHPFSDVLSAVQRACGAQADSQAIGQAIGRAIGQAIDWQTVAWVLPRVEQAGLLRAALQSALKCGLAAVPDTPSFALSPVIFTADRLSDHAASPVWLDLHLTVFNALDAWPQLVRHARSLSERWQLAGEYLDLAHAWVGGGVTVPSAAADGGGDVGADTGAQLQLWAGLEASIVQAFATTLRETLEQLQPQPPAHPAWSNISTVVWLDDGEPRVARWLARHTGERRVLRVDMLDGGQEAPCAVTGGARLNRDAADRALQAWPGQPGALHSPVLLDEASAQAASQAAAATIVDWLSRNDEMPVGVAVVDRLMARRVSSLLAAAGVRVDDRTGWRLSTTRVAGWLNCLLDGWLRQDWMTWLCGLEQHWVPAWTPVLQSRVLPVWSERANRRHRVSSWDDFRADALRVIGQCSAPAQSDDLGVSDLTPTDAVAVRAQLDRLMSAFSHLGNHPRPLRQWAADVHRLLDDLGSHVALTGDRAGDELLALLRYLDRTGSSQDCSAQEWMLILGTQLEGARFRPEDVRSPVRFMPLQSFRLQRFERVLVLGVGSRHFMPSPPGLLPPSVADELGLADPWLHHEQALCALSEIICNSVECALVHQRQSAGSADPLLGALRALGLRIRMQTGRNWAVSMQPQMRFAPRQDSTALSLGGLPQPQRLPVKAVASLAACPLQFALDSLVGCADAMDPVAQSSDAALRGIWLHDLFERLWRDVLPHRSGGADLAHGSAWMQPLRQALQAAWMALPAPTRPRLFQERLEFERHLSALADALAQRHAQGWALVAQEKSLSRALVFSDGYEPVQVHGRMDQLQQRDGAYGIVDIKTGRAETLRKQAAQWADHPQLPLYAWMLESACDSLAYLATRGDEPAYVELDGASTQQMSDIVVLRLQEAFVHLFVNSGQAAPLPGVDCQWCAHAGVCRSAWWQGAGVLAGGEGSDE